MYVIRNGAQAGRHAGQIAVRARNLDREVDLVGIRDPGVVDDDGAPVAVGVGGRGRVVAPGAELGAAARGWHGRR